VLVPRLHLQKTALQAYFGSFNHNDFRRGGLIRRRKQIIGGKNYGMGK
jgi:hypothetical protein